MLFRKPTAAEVLVRYCYSRRRWDEIRRWMANVSWKRIQKLSATKKCLWLECKISVLPSSFHLFRISPTRIVRAIVFRVIIVPYDLIHGCFGHVEKVFGLQDYHIGRRRLLFLRIRIRGLLFLLLHLPVRSCQSLLLIFVNDRNRFREVLALRG